MENQTNRELDHSLESDRDDSKTTDAFGAWFAAAVIFAFLAAGVIVYRTGDSDIRTASNDVPAAAHSDPIAPGPILPPR